MKRWKMLVAALMACVLTLSLVACGGGDTTTPPADGTTPDATTPTEPTGEQVTWRIAHTVAEVAALHIKAVEVAEEVAAATDGNFVVEVYPNSQLGGNRELLEGHIFGTIECSINNNGMLGGYSDASNAFALPYLISDMSNYDDASAVFLSKEMMAPAMEQLEEAGLLWAGSWNQGVRHLTTSKTPVYSPADMKGLKIRTMESEAHMAHFNALGANAIPMAFSEVFTALQQGAIDGQENPYYNIYTQGMHEVQGYIIETAHIFDITPFMVSKVCYDALPAEYQTIFMDAVWNMTLDEWKLSAEIDNEYKQKIIDGDYCEIIELSVDQRNAFKEAAMPVYDQFRDLVGGEWLDSLNACQE